jgi:hypothetical protein
LPRSSPAHSPDKADNVSNVLAQFLNAMRARHTIRTNVIHTKAGKPMKDAVKVISDATKLDTIYVHVGVDDKMLRMSSTYLSQWLGAGANAAGMIASVNHRARAANHRQVHCPVQRAGRGGGIELLEAHRAKKAKDSNVRP